MGGFAEYVKLPVSNLAEVPDGLSLELAALAEPAACCLSGLEMFEMPDGATILVIGGGLLALVTLAMAKRRGAGKSILSEPIEHRREWAKRLGADIIVDPLRDDLEAIVRDTTDGLGVHVAFEAVGKPELVDQAVGLTRGRGFVQLVGVSPDGSVLPSNLYRLHRNEITIRGAYGRGDAFGRALAMLPELHLDGIVTGRHPLEKIESGFAAAAAGEGIKNVIAPRES